MKAVFRYISAVVLLWALLWLGCRRDLTPVDGDPLLRVVTIDVDDPSMKRTASYELVLRRSTYSALFECGAEACAREIRSVQELPNDAELRNAAVFDFERYGYDLAVVTLPDPGHYSRLLACDPIGGGMRLKFGIYADAHAGAVPCVVVYELYLFRFQK